jgi:hypothetical protein
VRISIAGAIQAETSVQLSPPDTAWIHLSLSFTRRTFGSGTIWTASASVKKRGIHKIAFGQRCSPPDLLVRDPLVVAGLDC